MRRRSASRPVPLPDQLLCICGAGSGADSGSAVEWNGEPVQSIRKAFANVVKYVRVSGDVIPHSLRHTAATWLMQAGTDMWQAAGYLGMTIEMVSERYGHHHPDHLVDAKGAFARHSRAPAELGKMTRQLRKRA